MIWPISTLKIMKTNKEIGRNCVPYPIIFTIIETSRISKGVKLMRGICKPRLCDEVCFSANTDPLPGIIDGRLPPANIFIKQPQKCMNLYFQGKSRVHIVNSEEGYVTSKNQQQEVILLSPSNNGPWQNASKPIIRYPLGSIKVVVGVCWFYLYFFPHSICLFV